MPASPCEIKGEVVVMGDMNVHTKTLQSDIQKIDMPFFSRWVEDTFSYDHTFMESIEPNHHSKALLYMCNNIGLLISNDVLLWKDINSFPCRKYNEKSVD